jgi:hypothetical protein
MSLAKLESNPGSVPIVVKLPLAVHRMAVIDVAFKSTKSPTTSPLALIAPAVARWGQCGGDSVAPYKSGVPFSADYDAGVIDCDSFRCGAAWQVGENG